MQNSGTTESVEARPKILWHCVLIGLLLAVVASFFYFRHRLIQRAERGGAALAPAFQSLPVKQGIGRNLQRWHDSSLMFVALADFQIENDGNLPAHWDNSLFDLSRGALASIDSDKITIRSASDNSLSVTNSVELPDEDIFHIWSGYICIEDQRESYREDLGELTYYQIIKRGGNADFAIVYGAEMPDLDSGDLIYVKCLDSLNGVDSPNFIFKQIEPF